VTAVQALMKIEEAAKVLGVPKGSLRTAAKMHGFIVRMGRAERIDPTCFPELIKRCQDKPKEPAFISAPTGVSGSSATQGVRIVQPALEIAAKLKMPSRLTSPAKESSPGQVTRIGSK